MQSFLLIHISGRTENLSRAWGYLLVSYGYVVEGASAIKTCQTKRSLLRYLWWDCMWKLFTAHMAADKGEQMGKSLGGTEKAFLQGSGVLQRDVLFLGAAPEALYQLWLGVSLPQHPKCERCLSKRCLRIGVDLYWQRMCIGVQHTAAAASWEGERGAEGNQVSPLGCRRGFSFSQRSSNLVCGYFKVPAGQSQGSYLEAWSLYPEEEFKTFSPGLCSGPMGLLTIIGTCLKHLFSCL